MGQTLEQNQHAQHSAGQAMTSGSMFDGNNLRATQRPIKLKATVVPPAFLPSAVYLVEAGVATYSHILPAGLGPPVATTMYYQSKKLSVTQLSLCVNTEHPADPTTRGLHYRIYCESF